MLFYETVAQRCVKVLSFLALLSEKEFQLNVRKTSPTPLPMNADKAARKSMWKRIILREKGTSYGYWVEANLLESFLKPSEIGNRVVQFSRGSLYNVRVVCNQQKK